MIQHALFLQFDISNVWFKKIVTIHSTISLLWIVTVFLNQTLALLLKVVEVTIRGQNSCFEKRLHLIFIKKHTKSSFLLLKIKSYSVDSYQFIYPSVYFIIPFKFKVKFLEISYWLVSCTLAFSPILVKKNLNFFKYI